MINSLTRHKRSNLVKIAFSGLLLIIGPFTGLAQISDVPNEKGIDRYNPKAGIAPNAASIQRNEHSGVDMFHGCATVNIPLYSLKGEGMAYDIGLSYYSGGVRINEMPGLMGLSWSISGESQITRVVNGSPDEMFNTGFRSGGQAFEKGYYFFGNQFNVSNWSTTAFLSSYNDPLKAGLGQPQGVFTFDGQPDEFQFNFAGHSGSFLRSETGEWKVKSKENLDIKVEEVIHTREYNQTDDYRFNHNNWKSPGELNIDWLVPRVGTLFTQFTLTTADGYQYIFGGIDSAIEFTRGFQKPAAAYVNSHISYARTANTWKLSKIVSPLGEEIKFTYNRGKVIFQRDKNYIYGSVQGAAWNTPKLDYGLTAINPVYLYSIETSRGILYFKRSQAVEKWYQSMPVIGGCYLSTVVDVQDENEYLSKAVQGDGDYNNTQIAAVPPKLPHFNQQLDSLIYFDKISQQYVDGYRFVQSANPNVRRTLNELYRFNYKDSKTDSRYSFTYNDVAGLPDYDALSKDYWDYYNGSSDNITLCEKEEHDMPDFHTATSLHGMLTKIVNPLGGSTEFIYEGNEYAKKVKVDVATGTVGIENIPGLNNYGPGCRVKQIKHIDIYGAPAVIKKYVYHNNYPGTDAAGYSGVLNFDRVDDIVMIDHCSDLGTGNFPLANISTTNHREFTKMFKGGVINYSTVNEVNADNSYTTYRYSNVDDAAYRDELHSAYTSINIYQNTYPDKNFRISSTEMDRGNLLSVTAYNANNNKVKEVINTYDYNPLRKNKFIKASDRKILYSQSSLSCAGGGLKNMRAWAFKYYYYNTPLIRTEERVYNPDNTFVSNTNEYGYDDYGNITSQSTQTSDGKILTSITKYNSHPDYNGTGSSGAALGIKKLMQDYRIKNYPVEQAVVQAQVGTLNTPEYTAGSLITYRTDKPLVDKQYKLELTTPVSAYNATLNPNGFASSKNNNLGFFEYDNRFKQTAEVISYADVNGVIPKITTAAVNEIEYGGMGWDYKGLLQTAAIQNGRYEDMAYSGFEGDYTGDYAAFKNHWDFDHTLVVTGTAVAGTKYLDVSASTTLSSSQAILKSNMSLNSGRKYRIAFWAKGGNGVNFHLANGSSTNVLPLIKSLANGWKYYEYEFVSNGQAAGIICYSALGIPAAAQLDEVMLYPANAQMETYSYDTRTDKLSTMNNGSGSLAYYQYDGLGRLTQVLNEEGKIIKANEYKIQSN